MDSPQVFTQVASLQGIHRILDLLNFRDWLCSIPQTGLALEDGWRVTRGERRDDGDAEGEEAKREEAPAAAIDTERGGVLRVRARNKEEEQKEMMKNMAQLWLQQEVNKMSLPVLYRIMMSSGFLN